ncbi:hypothetical protein Ppa06_11430 [Planomonospora parontospora subsp. parontospora]|uniref:Uncharacterized protein n=2 Tax=Planomonospora parontospora TaxID=58119 RepID=A0AA37F3D9_9ACTN|nr:hypothetical protein [Planomonospora parontospora]GGK55698.1 hypothetical protein GCM10010126_14150 [Planomonospora parontospora]GII07345.1 hypothetical protein Ppa06_11430 [Planomonospora parontospora subsp. parontospora]
MTGWLPAVCAVALILTVLGLHGVSARDTAVFGLYLMLGVVLPGTLMIRALWSGRRTLAEELALGAALGYAVEAVAYIAARAAGAPLLVAVWPVAVYGAFLAVPRLRRHWRGGPRLRTPVWWSWSVVLVVAFMVVRPMVIFFDKYDITHPEIWAGGADLSFHLALIGELRHHVPPTVPAVSGEPLLYHWFVYAHLAATSWVTGVEPAVLLFRLAMLPMLTGFLILVGMTGRRVTGSWAGGVLSVVGTVFLKAPNLYEGENWVLTYGGVQDITWSSPTQTYGALLFAPVVLLVLELLQRRRHDTGRWVLIGVFLLAVTGAKAIYLPLLGAGLAMVIAVELVRRRRISWPASILLGGVGACLLFAQAVLFGGANQGMTLDPLALFRMGWMRLSGLGSQIVPSQASVLGLTLLYVLGWTVAWSGISGLLSRPKLLLRPAVLLMLGIGGAGLGVAFLFGHPGFSQLFFLMGAVPYVVIIAVYGLIVLLRWSRVPSRATVLAAAAGAVLALLFPAICGVALPLGPDRPDSVLYPTQIAFVIAAGLMIIALFVTVGVQRAWALTIVVFMAMSLPGNVRDRIVYQRKTSRTPPVSQDALTVLRWLRDHSHPDELIATTVHCRWWRRDPCDTLHFWVTAFSERRVLVEGWGYTPTNLRNWTPGRSLQLPFWDRRRFEANKKAFYRSSAGAVRRLRERYGVDWLFVDERQPRRGGAVGDFAELRFRAGDYSVYSVPDGGAAGARSPEGR